MLFKIYSCGWGSAFSLRFLPLVAREWSRKGVGDADDRCPGLAGMAPASEVAAAEVSGFISFSHLGQLFRCLVAFPWFCFALSSWA